ncbi:hypothetical protein diail_3601 [Diaporthe ilicicola]|nr:hypothetical protein diail_3601 [Diaporthe ilicicola]
MNATTPRPDTTTALLGFSEHLPGDERQKFHLNSSEPAVMNIMPRETLISNTRHWHSPPSLDDNGFTIVIHKTATKNMYNQDEVHETYEVEVRKLLLDFLGADELQWRGQALYRSVNRTRDKFGGDIDFNSNALHFVHIDATENSTQQVRSRALAAMTIPHGKRIKRALQFNTWQPLTAPPQYALSHFHDIPLYTLVRHSLLTT